ncbi:MAG: hypothetical protein BGO30_04025 [Bacteroidetes bacterium 41-46]|nr:MAG: hypothetical protein BGO30_04025 [Bacteroidetes bacterium 41-46]
MNRDKNMSIMGLIELNLLDRGKISSFVNYRIEYLEEMQGFISDSYKEILREKFNAYFTGAIDEGRFFGYVLKEDDKEVSFGGMVLKEIPGDINKPLYTEGEILNMYTLPEARKKGYSSAVLKALIDEAERRGVSKISLHTSKDGERLYRSFGFCEPAFPVLERGL